MDLRCDPAFVEEAVFLALRSREAAGEGRLRRDFFVQREGLYD